MKSSKAVTQYKKNFLDEVVLRIDFEKIELGKLTIFSDQIKKDFPLTEEKNTFQRTIQIDEKADKVNNLKTALSFWVFSSENQNKKITVSSSYLAIQYLNRSYKNAAELILDTEKIILSFTSVFNVVTINRLGLRYLNRFDLDGQVAGEFKWKDYFSASLIGGDTFARTVKGNLTRSMSELHLRFDDKSVQMGYGIWNQDFPNKNTRKEFIIDIDCYSNFPLEGSEMSFKIKDYNLIVQRIFEKSITNKVRKLLGDEK